ncbi:helix-turn-helix domain-containing protein [Amycolatopsis dendrobii]|uniref:Helix-turn-helix transcriptional regulator n=1 Tax=Amycolatopsis dendrobii TaxID=2760662 RepID=A0A7W3W3B9_9PSEU|nr:helix-turn-helix transcriptional regulator [Amycolatopsis dendrobii]
MPPSPRTRILGAALRNARVEANFGLRELARRIGVTPAALSSWEQARRTPALADVAGLLGAIGTSGELKRDILRLARGGPDEWWVVHGAPASPARAAALVAHKVAAQDVVTWDPFALPELLQISHQQPETRPPLIEAFISDVVLQTNDERTGALQQQLRRLLRSAGASRSLVLRTVRAELAWAEGFTTAFDRYSLPDDKPVVYCGQRSFGVFAVERTSARPVHEAEVQRLRQIALHPQQSRDHILRCIAAVQSV